MSLGQGKEPVYILPLYDQLKNHYTDTNPVNQVEPGPGKKVHYVQRFHGCIKTMIRLRKNGDYIAISYLTY